MIEVSRVQPTAEVLETYAGIPSEFEVTSRVDIRALDSGAIVPIPVEPPYTKSLDGEELRAWSRLHDLSQWGLFIACEDGVTIGACAVAMGVPGIYFDSGPDDAVLWDIRVSAEHRGRGAGKALIEAAASWARAKGCKALLIETQDTNIVACRLYLSAGCTVRETVPHAYQEHPEDLLILWRLDLH